jgi:cell division protein FtsL
MLLIVVPILLYFGITTINRALETYTIRQSSERVRAEIAVLMDRNAQLRRQRAYLESNEYIERIAREELDLVKPGETAIVIVTPREQQRAQQQGIPEPPAPPPPPNWQRWLEFFFAETPVA